MLLGIGITTTTVWRSNEPRLSGGAELYSIDIISTNRAIIDGYRAPDGSWQSVRRQLYYGTDSTLHLTPGDRITSYCRVREYGDSGYIRIKEINTHREESSRRWAHNINSWAYGRLEELDLSPDALSVVGAMLLGRRDLMDRQLTLSYRESGAAHILAVSGLHLAIIFLVVNNLLLVINIFPYGHIARKILIIIILWLYAAIVGMSPSVVRAASMLTVYQLIYLLHRRYYSINALLIAVVAMVLLDPSILFDVGFQLSVVAVLGILYWAAPLLRPLDRWSWSQNWGYLMPILFESVVATLIVGVACSVALLPLISYTFGYVSLLGILLNPLLIVTTFITLTLSLLWVLFGFGELPALIVGRVIEGMTLIQNNAVGSIAEPISLRLELWETLSIYLLYGLITFLCYRVKRAHSH